MVTATTGGICTMRAFARNASSRDEENPESPTASVSGPNTPVDYSGTTTGLKGRPTARFSSIELIQRDFDNESPTTKSLRQRQLVSIAELRMFALRCPSRRRNAVAATSPQLTHNAQAHRRSYEAVPCDEGERHGSDAGLPLRGDRRPLGPVGSMAWRRTVTLCARRRSRRRSRRRWTAWPTSRC